VKMLPVDIVRIEEPFTIAHLADGTRVKVKVVINKCARTIDDDGKPAFNPDGSPAYQLMFGPIVLIDAPESAMLQHQPVKP